jgi:hypothetical protein
MVSKNLLLSTEECISFIFFMDFLTTHLGEGGGVAISDKN